MRRVIVFISTLVVFAIAATPAAAEELNQSFNNWVAKGSLTPKKLNEPVVLPQGSTFNGSAHVTFHIVEGSISEPSGTVVGTVSVPPFNASLKLLGLVPTTVGVTFTQVGSAEGTIEPAPAATCPEKTGPLSPCTLLHVPTRVIIGITKTEPLGIEIPTHCETVEPMTFDLSTHVTLFGLALFGPQFTGSATIPPMECSGPEALVLEPALTTLMSGPDNAYEIELAPPNALPRPKA